MSDFKNINKMRIGGKYLSKSNSHMKENFSQIKGAENISVVAMDDWLDELHPSTLELDNWLQLTPCSLMWTRTGNRCILTIKLDWDLLSFVISTFKSLISRIAFGVCNIQERIPITWEMILMQSLINTTRE